MRRERRPRSLRRARRALAQRRLRCREPRDAHAEWRARHVVEADLVAEGDRGGIAAMLAANAELEVFPRPPSALGCDAHEFADAVAVDRHERIDGKDALVAVRAEEACRVVAADAEGGLRQIVG